MSEQLRAERREFEAQVIAKAWKDDAFAEELRANPKAVIEREWGKIQPGAKLPDDLEIRVVEETPTTLYLVLPARPPVRGEVPSADLESVAGGAGCHPTNIVDPRDTCS